MSDVTQILNAIEAGEPTAAAQLLPLVYDELRKLAAAQMANEKPGHTLDATALVHEAWLRLVPDRRGEPGSSPAFENRRHFFAAAAEVMRRILVESARRKARHKHGGAMHRIEWDGDVPDPRGKPDDLLAFDEALERLAREDPAAAEVVKLHVFTGMTLDETAEALALSRATVFRHWAYARAWLRSALSTDK
jgi:RNA polymerase sigma factor (TIGR02999 family)